jgi:glyoxylate/hydroxypyruvate reductase
MGLGTIGLLCATMLRALGFQVHGWARSPKTVSGIPCLVGQGAFGEFLTQSDLLVGLLPDTPETRGLICRETIMRLPKGAAVINVARGPLVVLDDLLAALDDNHLSAAVLDVFETEPLPAAHPVWAHPKVTVTAHIAGFASREARAQKVAQNIEELESGRMPSGLYDAVRRY